MALISGSDTEYHRYAMRKTQIVGDVPSAEEPTHEPAEEVVPEPTEEPTHE